MKVLRFLVLCALASTVALGVVSCKSKSKPGSVVVVKGTVVASRKGRVFHRPSCSGARQIKIKNRMAFRSARQALKRGLRPHKDCIR